MGVFTAKDVSAGKLLPLAFNASDHSLPLPDVPKMAELGFSGLEVSAWFGLLAPAKTPKPIVEWLNKHSNEIFSSPKMMKSSPNGGWKCR